MFALVLDDDPDVRTQELDVLKQSPFKDLESEVTRLVGHLDKLHVRYRLPLFDMAIPELKGLALEERASLVETLKLVIDADRKIKLDELTVYVMLKAHLSETAGQAGKEQYKTLASLRKEITLLLSLLAYLGRSGHHSSEAVFEAASEVIEPLLPSLALQQPESFRPDEIISALEKFSGLSPALKGKLVLACITAVLFDEEVTTSELELMRSICTTMDVPMPPVLVDKL